METVPGKKGNGDFDVTMGSYDGAEICQLVGQYMTWCLSEEISKDDMGLYRDDGLSVVNDCGRQIEKEGHTIVQGKGAAGHC